MFLHTNFLTSTSRILASASASAHLIMWSTATITNLWFLVARGNSSIIFSPHYAKGHRILIGFKLPAGWCIKGACFWHCSHFWTYLSTSLCIYGHQNPWVIARWANERPPTWLLQTPLWSLVKSSSILLGCKHWRYSPSKDLWYSVWSTDNQYRAAIQRTLSASFPSASTRPSAKKSMIGSIQQGSNTATTETFALTSMLGSATTLHFNQSWYFLGQWWRQGGQRICMSVFPPSNLNDFYLMN